MLLLEKIVQSYQQQRLALPVGGKAVRTIAHQSGSLLRFFLFALWKPVVFQNLAWQAFPSPRPSLANPRAGVSPCTLSDTEKNGILVSTWKFKYRRGRTSSSTTLSEIGSVS